MLNTPKPLNLSSGPGMRYCASSVRIAPQPWAAIAREVLDGFTSHGERQPGPSRELSGWVVTHRTLLLDFGQAVVGRARFNAMHQRVVAHGEVASQSVADVAWRHFDEEGVAERWTAENRPALERLTLALISSA